MSARLKERYRNEVAAQLKDALGLANPMDVPTLEKIVVNVGTGEAIDNKKIVDDVTEDLRVITGQTPRVNIARKSIAGFKLREGLPVGVLSLIHI